MFSNEAGLGIRLRMPGPAQLSPTRRRADPRRVLRHIPGLLHHGVHHPRLRGDLAAAERGIGLTQDALVGTLGRWYENIALSVIIFLLAFSSILGNYYYGEMNIE